MTVKAIIFDKDGTLLDFDAFWLTVSKNAINEILKEISRQDIPTEKILSALGVKNDITDINGVLCRGTYSQIAQEMYNTLIKYGCVCTFDDIEKRTIDAYHRNSDKGIVKATCDNICDVITGLKNMGIKLAVVTTDDPFVTQKCLQLLNIDKLFDIIYTDDGKLPTKPDPYCIYDLCERYGITTSDVIMVGDTVTDMNFAKNGGIKAIGVAKNENNKAILIENHAYIVIPDISYVFDVLKEDNL
ncbi:MAG: HAD family hydrolase [Clostridia bacterium]|nr:HAD family hydrolase [Clostridia bacterium]